MKPFLLKSQTFGLGQIKRPINKQYFHRKTRLKFLGYLISLKGLESIGIMRVPVGLRGVERSFERTRGLVKDSEFRKGNRILRYGCRNVTRFRVFQDRILKLSG